MVGPVLDADGVAVTDCVVADFEGSVNGGDPAALNGSATLTHRGVGFYSLALTATDLGTVGQFEVTINDTVNACPMKEITVIEEAIYDAMFAASANAFQGAAGSTKVTGVVLVDTLTTYTGNTPQTGDAYAYLGTNVGALGANLTAADDAVMTRLGAPAGASVSADIAAVKSDTAAILDDTGTSGVVVASLAANSVNASALAADAVTEIWAGSTAPSAATIADAVWDEDATAHQTQGTFGQAIGDPGADTDSIWALANTNLDAAVSTRSTLTQTQVTGGAYSLASASFAFNTALPLTVQQKADVYTEVASAFNNFDPPSLLELQTELAPILADTNELQTDWANGGRLDLLIDGIVADLPTRITKNTALSAFMFKMVDATDHVTAETGVTVTATRSLDGAAFASCTNSPAEVSGGWYKIDLAAGDLNGNVVVLKFTGTGCDTTEIVIVTEPT